MPVLLGEQEPPQIAEAQRLLTTMGLSTGDADGKAGPRTHEMVRDLLDLVLVAVRPKRSSVASAFAPLHLRPSAEPLRPPPSPVPASAPLPPPPPSAVPASAPLRPPPPSAVPAP